MMGVGGPEVDWTPALVPEAADDDEPLFPGDVVPAAVPSVDSPFKD